MVNLVNTGDAVFSASREAKTGGFLKKEVSEAQRLTARFSNMIKSGGTPASAEIQQGRALLKTIEDRVELHAFMEAAIKTQSDSDLDRVGREIDHVQSATDRLRRTMKAFDAN